ncbi:hypothetical protein CSC02_1108 [Enterobacter hormaechei subsp. hoffmannii]|nr:hypothetical protein CSC02_1108 [Enterobacter hormaechei subsp. hoffmannii]
MDDFTFSHDASFRMRQNIIDYFFNVLKRLSAKHCCYFIA